MSCLIFFSSSLKKTGAAVGRTGFFVFNSDAFFQEAALVAIVTKPCKGGFQFLSELRLVVSVVGVEILLMDHYIDLGAILHSSQLLQNGFHRIDIQHNINGAPSVHPGKVGS